MFYVTEMPINKYGDGPEMDEKMVKQVLWEIWDTDCALVCTLHNQHTAIKVCADLNRYWVQYGR